MKASILKSNTKLQGLEFPIELDNTDNNLEKDLFIKRASKSLNKIKKEKNKSGKLTSEPIQFEFEFGEFIRTIHAK